MKWKPHKRKDLTKWHRWFAWHPVFLLNSDGMWAWLCCVDRKWHNEEDCCGGDGYFLYKELEAWL